MPAVRNEPAQTRRRTRVSKLGHRDDEDVDDVDSSEFSSSSSRHSRRAGGGGDREDDRDVDHDRDNDVTQVSVRQRRQRSASVTRSRSRESGGRRRSKSSTRSSTTATRLRKEYDPIHRQGGGAVSSAVAAVARQARAVCDVARGGGLVGVMVLVARVVFLAHHADYSQRNYLFPSFKCNALRTKVQLLFNSKFSSKAFLMYTIYTLLRNVMLNLFESNKLSISIVEFSIISAILARHHFYPKNSLKANFHPNTLFLPLFVHIVMEIFVKNILSSLYSKLGKNGQSKAKRRNSTRNASSLPDHQPSSLVGKACLNTLKLYNNFFALDSGDAQSRSAFLTTYIATRMLLNRDSAPLDLYSPILMIYASTFAYQLLLSIRASLEANHHQNISSSIHNSYKQSLQHQFSIPIHLVYLSKVFICHIFYSNLPQYYLSTTQPSAPQLSHAKFTSYLLLNTLIIVALALLPTPLAVLKYVNGKSSITKYSKWQLLKFVLSPHVLVQCALVTTAVILSNQKSVGPLVTVDNAVVSHTIDIFMLA